MADWRGNLKLPIVLISALCSFSKSTFYVLQSATEMEKAHLIAEEADSLNAQLEEERQLLAQVCAFNLLTFVTCTD